MTPWEIAKEWYQADDIANAIQKSGGGNLGAWDSVPEDVYSEEFAEWVTHHCRCAMAKGILLAAQENKDGLHSRR